MKVRIILFTVGVSGCLYAAQGQTASDDFYTVAENSALTAPTPGVLSNDTTGTNGASLTAELVVPPAQGALNLNADGSFVYTPTNDFTGVDGFTYRAVNGSQTSSVATVVLMVLAPGELFDDNFTRPTGGGSIFPWTQKLGPVPPGTWGASSVGITWSLTNGLMQGTGTNYTYGYSYFGNTNWTDYSIQGRIRFSGDYAASAGLMGRLDPITGSHYSVYIYPEQSDEGNIPPVNGIPRLWLYKYQTWTIYTNIGPWASLPAVGTNWHTLKLTFQGNHILAYFDGSLVTNVTDDGAINGQPAYLHGAAGVNQWISTVPYTLSVDDVVAGTGVAVANSDAYAATNNIVLKVPAPGVLADDVGNGMLAAILADAPAHGGLVLSNDGGFSYAPTNGFLGTDGFTYQCTDGQTTSGVTTVTLTVKDAIVAGDDTYQMVANKLLNVAPPGVLANDQGGVGPLAVELVSGPAAGALVLTNYGGFSYAPGTNFTGLDGFTYRVTDGAVTSDVATVHLFVMPPGALFYDNFARPAGAGSIFPWVRVSGSWSITNQQLAGTGNLNSYSYACYQNSNWTDYAVQAQLRFSTSNAWGAAIGGRLNPATGARYDLWVIPEGSPWGPYNGVPAGVPALQLVKYRNWTNYTAEPLVKLPGVGTNWHNLKLAFKGANAAAYFDGNLITNLADNGNFDGRSAYTNGGISLALYTGPSLAYTVSVSNVTVTPLVVDDNYRVEENTTLTVPQPGVLSNDTGIWGTNLTATLIAGPTDGVMYLNANGGFAYTPNANFTGTDVFTVGISDGAGVLGTATANLTILPGTDLAPPIINSIDLSNGAAAITWDSLTGATYRVQYEQNLRGTNWINLSPDITATGSTAAQTNPLQSVAHGFYRVILLTP